MHTTLPSNTLNKLTPHKVMRAALTGLLALVTGVATVDVCAQSRTDNVRIFWTGTNGDVWDNNNTASWMTTGSYLTYASGTAGTETWVEIDAIPEATFITGDVVAFDSRADQGWTWSGSAWRYDPGEGGGAPPTASITRNIEIATEGVTVSDMIISGPGSYVFTGGAITAIASSVAPDSVQLSGTGVGLAAGLTSPGGRLIKTGPGILTLSNTAANHFENGIHLFEGTLAIADNRALGDNCIVSNYVTTAGGIEGQYGHFIGDRLLPLVQQPGVTSGNSYLPAAVLDIGGNMFNSANGGNFRLLIEDTAAGIDITGDIYISSRNATFEIQGDTTISGRIVGNTNSYGASAGSIIKTGTGTLTITGSRNWFYGSSKNYNQINEGRVVLTHQHAFGTGATLIDTGGILEFRGVSGTMRQAFIGGGNIEVTQGSDLTFNWRNGTLDNFDMMSGNGSWHPAMNDIATLTISGQSRFSAIASGTYSTVLGGANVYVTVTEGSTLVIGREGLSARGSGATGIPMNYAILANRIDLAGGSTLVLKPNAFLSTGALVVTDTSNCNIAFTASGVMRLRWQEGIDPDTISRSPDADASARYIVPAGMELIINDIPVPVPPSESLPNDNSSTGWCREFVIVNQGANPLKDIAMTLTAVDAIHDTVSSRLAAELIDPVILHVPSKGRKWVNSAWARYLTSKIDFETESLVTPGVSGRINGGIFGLDGILPGRLLVGIHGGIADNNLDTTNDTTLSSKQKYLGLHAAQRFGKFYLSLVAATGKVSTDSFRYESDNFVRGKWDTSYYSGFAEFGGTFESWSKIKVKPHVGLRYSRVKISNYYERGASPLVVDNFDDTLAQASYGVDFGRSFIVLKRDLAVDLTIARKHNIRAPRANLVTYYFDSPTTPVTLKRGDYYDDVWAFGLSARAALSQHSIVGFACDYETASSRNRLTFSAMVGYTW
ncbi:hypothetical protein M2447_000225 [Ereboglobus sp. PH5-10]|uniref:autotransporter family protein n=1 Tax=Ereboglobus sp. PH5-10 TaxID=2940629 RepID=UPI0024051E38|nr:autotransporter domain-containing protein [Ereboglobus sp. PH5-10]MDF9826149.1 hypothetical protein [Ereboglobus sp. PH5-10]